MRTLRDVQVSMECSVSDAACINTVDALHIRVVDARSSKSKGIR
jgi:hypothetical protein